MVNENVFEKITKWPTKTKVISGSVAALAVLVLLGAIASFGGNPEVEDATSSKSNVEVQGRTVKRSTTSTTETSSSVTLETNPTIPVSTVPYIPLTTIAPVYYMPNVICMNLQDAQDTIQDAGVFYSRSTDASGQGRSQIVDSNWVVVGQYPSAGVPFGEGEAVLEALKYGEFGLC